MHSGVPSRLRPSRILVREAMLMSKREKNLVTVIIRRGDIEVEVEAWHSPGEGVIRTETVYVGERR